MPPHLDIPFAVSGASPPQTIVGATAIPAFSVLLGAPRVGRVWDIERLSVECAGTSGQDGNLSVSLTVSDVVALSTVIPFVGANFNFTKWIPEMAQLPRVNPSGEVRIIGSGTLNAVGNLVGVYVKVAMNGRNKLVRLG